MIGGAWGQGADGLQQTLFFFVKYDHSSIITLGLLGKIVITSRMYKCPTQSAMAAWRKRCALNDSPCVTALSKVPEDLVAASTFRLGTSDER